VTRALLVVGAPRSGTTWVARALAAGAGARYLEEPDNHLRFAFALRAKARARCGPYPLLTAGDDPAARADLVRLWEAALAPGTSSRATRTRRRVADRLVRVAGEAAVDAALAGRTGAMLRTAMRLAVPERAARPDGPLVVKSVFAPLDVEWIARRQAVEVVIVLRDPLDIASSWVTMGWLDGPEPLEGIPAAIVDELTRRFGAAPPAGPLGRATWLTGVLTCALEEALARNPAWHRAQHRDLCVAPTASFARLAAATGLDWTAAGPAFLERSDRPGSGYATERVAAELEDVWRTRLDERQVHEVVGVLAGLPLPSWVRLD
jgi:hypothetical protein